MGQPFFLSQCSIADDDLFGSGDDDSDNGGNRNSAMETDDVFGDSSNSDQLVPSLCDDVFLRRHSDQVVPEESYDTKVSTSGSSSSVESKREAYRLSRESGNVNIEENGMRRTLSLPDIVPKDVEMTGENCKSKRLNLSDNSPDVVSSSENKSSSDDRVPSMTEMKIDSILRQPSSKKRNIFRSVSFQDKKSKEESTEQADTRRKNFRSSGYGTGSGESDTLAHSQSSQGSVFNVSNEDPNYFDDQDCPMDFLNRQEYYREELPSPSWSDSPNEKETVISGRLGNKTVYCDMIPLLSAMNQPSLTSDNPPSDDSKTPQTADNSSMKIHSNDKNNSSREIDLSLISDSSIQFQIPDLDILLNDPTSNATGSSTSDSDSSLTHVQKKYCNKKDEGGSKSPPSFATRLPSFQSADTGLPSSISDSAMALAVEDNFDYRSYKEYMTKEILQQEDITEAQKLELLESPITPSPRDYNLLALQKITSELVERSSRCRDVFCVYKFCKKVREGFIGLNHTLEGRWPYGSSTDVSDLCVSLGRHSAAPCDELKCFVKCCYFLSAEFSEPPRGEYVYQALKRHYDTPVLSSIAFPPKIRVSNFYKLDEHYRRDKPMYTETLTTFGDYGNVYMMDDFTVIKKIKFQNCDFDIDNTVYKKLCNRQHKHLVDHIWAAVYQESDEIHVCTNFFRGGSLEELLQRRSFLNPVIVKEYVLQILDALIYLHQQCGVIYLYWTTSNILFLDTVRRHILISNMSLSVPKYSEFDVGYIKQSLPPCLLPPELIFGDEDLKLTPAADSWGLGCMMLEMLTGKQMWYNERHDQKNMFIEKMKNRSIKPENNIPRNNRLPEIFNRVISRCFEFDPKKRISCEEIQKEIFNWKYN